jgi:hypothetical protein
MLWPAKVFTQVSCTSYFLTVEKAAVGICTFVLCHDGRKALPASLPPDSLLVKLTRTTENVTREWVHARRFFCRSESQRLGPLDIQR